MTKEEKKERMENMTPEEKRAHERAQGTEEQHRYQHSRNKGDMDKEKMQEKRGSSSKTAAAITDHYIKTQKARFSGLFIPFNQAPLDARRFCKTLPVSIPVVPCGSRHHYHMQIAGYLNSSFRSRC